MISHSLQRATFIEFLFLYCLAVNDCVAFPLLLHEVQDSKWTSLLFQSNLNEILKEMNVTGEQKSRSNLFFNAVVIISVQRMTHFKYSDSIGFSPLAISFVLFCCSWRI